MISEPSLPDFTPLPMLGLAMGFLPRQLLERGVRTFTHRLNTLHPGLRERLSEANGKSFALVLPDMPFNAMLEVEGGELELTMLGKSLPLRADVTLHGTSTTFIALLEGRTDGDALFFSRDLRVEGDTEALLVLRNALDNEQINLRKTFFSVFGALSGMAARAATPVEKLGARFTRDMGWLYHSAIAPLAKRQQQFSEGLQGLEHRISQVESALAKKQARSAENA